MKLKITYIICLLIMAGPCTGTAMEMTLSAQTGCHYSAWQSDNGTSGSQWYTPLTIDGRFDRFTLRLVSAYLSAGYSSDTDGSQSVATLVDTKANFSYELIKILPIDMLFGLDFNLPTGRTNLDVDELALIMDPDLVPITRYGEGFNVNPSFTLGKTWRNWQAGASIGYTWRGTYDFSTFAQDYDPGDIISLAAEAQFRLSPAWRLRGFGGYAYYGTDTVGGETYYQEGNFIMAGAGAAYAPGKKWKIDASLAGILRGKSHFGDASSTILTEDQNSQGNELMVNIGAGFFPAAKVTLNTRLSYLWMGENGFDDNSPFHKAGRQKYALTAGMGYQFTDKFQADLTLTGFWMNEGPSWDHPDETITYQGGSAMVLFTYSFL